MGVPQPEFQAVVLAAGSGSRFMDITAQKPKCLLPIGNLPMIWYPLNMLQKIGFQEVIVVVNENLKSEVSSVPKRFGGLGGLHLNVVSIPAASANSDLGTAGVLRLINGQLKSPRVMVVSSDLITDVQIHNLTDLHRVHGAAVTALFSRSGLEYKDIPVPGPKSKPKKERDLVGIDLASNGQLCFMSSEADLDESVTIRRSLLREHPRISMFSNLVDAHFYILEKWVCDYLQTDQSISSIKGELIPLLVKKQFRTPKQVDPVKAEDETPNAKGKAFAGGETDLLSFAAAATDPMVSQAQDLSHWNDHSDNLKGMYHGRPLRCYAFIMEGGTCVRANNLYTYCDLNRQISRLMTSLAPQFEHPLVHPNSKLQPRAQVGTECLVGEGTLIAEKTTTKATTIGINCRVEEKVRLTNCLIMDNVTVKEGCQVSGSLLCDGVVLPEGCEVKDCIVGKGYIFKAGAKHTNELLLESRDRMMEIE